MHMGVCSIVAGVAFSSKILLTPQNMRHSPGSATNTYCTPVNTGDLAKWLPICPSNAVGNPSVRCRYYLYITCLCVHAIESCPLGHLCFAPCVHPRPTIMLLSYSEQP